VSSSSIHRILIPNLTPDFTSKEATEVESCDLSGGNNDEDAQSLEGAAKTAASIAVPGKDRRTVLGGSGPRDFILDMTVTGLSEEVLYITYLTLSAPLLFLP
jgi:hypothetical protein